MTARATRRPGAAIIRDYVLYASIAFMIGAVLMAALYFRVGDEVARIIIPMPILATVITWVCLAGTRRRWRERRFWWVVVPCLIVALALDAGMLLLVHGNQIVLLIAIASPAEGVLVGRIAKLALGEP